MVNVARTLQYETTIIVYIIVLFQLAASTYVPITAATEGMEISASKTGYAVSLASVYPSSSNVFFQTFTPSCTPSSPLLQVTPTNRTWVYALTRQAYLSNGNLALIWYKAPAICCYGNMSILVLQMYSPNLTPIGSETELFDDINHGQFAGGVYSPAIAQLGSTGRFLVSWQDITNSFPAYSFQHQLFDVNYGFKVGAPFDPFLGSDPISASWTRLVTINHPNAGIASAVLVYETQGNSIYGVSVASLDSRGRLLPGFPVALSQSSSDGSYYLPYLASSVYSPGYAVVYQEQANNGRYVIMNIFPNASLPNNIRIPVTFDALGSPNNPTVTQLTNTNYIVTWEFSPGPQAEFCFFSIYTANGRVVVSAVQYTASNEYNNTPKVQSLADGGFVICWNNLMMNPPSNMCQSFNAEGKAVVQPTIILVT
eukprot:TRINITY_DN413_c0_g1_i1.p1 TRINITY_DN413_c0_g1~~TRINITY_DN413_c0_g1_i1.p1  ORF type:complete len:426 (-),score=28.88 TRINITY_DN413_c0_g1_i1:156-1433(-)